jgi:hypothetical protein
MTLSASTLATKLKELPLYDDEGEAISGFTDAFSDYFSDAMSNAIQISALALPAAKTAMETAMIALLSSNAANALTLGITAFWGALVPATAWTTVTLITPPVLLASLETALLVTFNNNKTGKLSKDVSMTAIASTIHTNNLGGLATWPSPVGAVAIT